MNSANPQMDKYKENHIEAQWNKIAKKPKTERKKTNYLYTHRNNGSQKIME
jgi:hypothetical protein